MERITTNHSAYFNGIREELLEIPPCNDRKPIFTYCEIGQLLTHGYSISFLIRENSCLFIKEWNATYEYRYFGIRSETGHDWYNFDPFSNLECGARCLADNADSEDDEMEIGWQTIGILLEDGRIYE